MTGLDAEDSFLTFHSQAHHVMEADRAEGWGWTQET